MTLSEAQKKSNLKYRQTQKFRDWNKKNQKKIYKVYSVVKRKYPSIYAEINSTTEKPCENNHNSKKP